MFKILRPALLITAIIAPACLIGASAKAITPQRFTQTTESDFEPGEVDGTLVTSLGDIKLATESTTIGQMPEEASVIYDMQQMPDDTLYLAAGPKGMILKQVGDKIELVKSLDNEQVFAIGEYEGKLLVAISGEKSRLATLGDDGELNTLIELEGVRYIWDVIQQGDALIVATGTDGKLLKVVPGSEEPITELYDAKQANILSLALDHQGRIIIGTDEDGLVLRLTVDEAGKVEVYALFDAPEPEIGALLVGADGTLYVGTADADQARPGRLEEASSEDTGKPEAEASEEKKPGEVPPDEIPGAEPKPEPVEAVEPAPIEQPTDADAQPEAAPEPAVTEDPLKKEDQAETEQPEAKPTPEQYDRLRELIRQRLQTARKAGQLQAGPMVSGAPGKSAGSASRAQPVAAPAVEKQGNAVYHIDNQGFVQELFRDSVMILKLVEHDGKILAATGNEGQVFVINPETHENAVLVDFEAEQVPAMMIGDNGSTFIGTANPAELFTLGTSYGHVGTYTSAALDAAQISLWGSLNVTADIPDGCSLTIETRSSNVQDPEQAAWSPWSQPQALMPDAKLPDLTPKEVTIQSPPARFLQYRLTLTGSDDKTPVVDRVEAAYVTPNLKPVINKVTAAYAEATDPDAPPATAMNIEWEAADDNQDVLLYKLEYQPAGSDYHLLIDKDLTEMTYEWETRRVPDGRYIVRVTASDRTNNPGDMAMSTTRRAAPVLVDNSPPDLTTDKTITGRQIKISGKATDAWSAIGSIAYTLDDNKEYVPVLPNDLIFDSTSEDWSVTIPDLSPGPHVLTLRATDARGNAVYRSVIFNIK